MPTVTAEQIERDVAVAAARTAIVEAIGAAVAQHDLTHNERRR